MKKILLPLLATLCIFASCRISVEWSGVPSESYSDSDRYTRGGDNLNIDDYPIEALEIDWVKGSIQIAYHDEQTISFSETSNHSLRSAWKLHYYYSTKDETLKIKYCESGVKIDSDIKKTLTVYLPRDYKLPFLDVDSASADLYVTNIYCDDIDYNSASGDAEFTLLGTTRFIEIDTASGDAIITVPNLKGFEVDTASGDFTLLCTESAPNEFEIDLASGDVDLTIPENTGFTLDYGGLAKSFVSTDFPLSVKGKKYIYGDGSRKYEIDGASSKVTLHKYVPPVTE